MVTLIGLSLFFLFPWTLSAFFYQSLLRRWYFWTDNVYFLWKLFLRYLQRIMNELNFIGKLWMKRHTFIQSDYIRCNFSYTHVPLNHRFYSLWNILDFLDLPLKISFVGAKHGIVPVIHTIQFFSIYKWCHQSIW